MDSYSEYNQFPMLEVDRDKTTFMIERANYRYNFIPFILKNISKTYQRMMNKIFRR